MLTIQFAENKNANSNPINHKKFCQAQSEISENTIVPSQLITSLSVSFHLLPLISTQLFNFSWAIIKTTHTTTNVANNTY